MKTVLWFITLSFFFLTSLAGQVTDTEPITIGENIKLYSDVLDEEREIFIYIPEGLWGMDIEMKHLPVIYVLDGGSQFANTASTVDYHSSAPNGNDLMPRSIVVGIPNTNRDRDLTPTKDVNLKDAQRAEVTGGGPQFLEFITTELIPYIDSNYSTCDHRTIIGHSLGGLLAFHTLLTKREYFDNYIVIDPGFGHANKTYMKQVLDTLDNVDLRDEHLYFAAANSRPTYMGIEDLMADTSEIMLRIDKPNLEFFNYEKSSNWKINFAKKYYESENHFAVPYLATYDAFRFFYSDYSFAEMMNFYHHDYSDRNDLVPLLKEHYKKISQHFGCEVLPMQGYINSYAFGMAYIGRHDLAMDLFNLNIALYPNQSASHTNLGYYYQNNDNKQAAVNQFNKSLKLAEEDNIRTLSNRLQKELDEQKSKE